jgi:hypothetical protein
VPSIVGRSERGAKATIWPYGFPTPC